MNSKELYKALISFITIITFSALITGCSVKKGDQTVNKISGYSSQILSLLSTNIQNELSKIESNSAEIAFSNLVQKGINDYNNMNALEMEDFKTKLNQLVVITFAQIPEVVDVKLLLPNGDLIYSMNTSEIRSEEFDKLLKNASVKKGVANWLISDKNIIMTRTALSIKSPDKSAIIIVDLNESFISKTYKNVNLGKNSSIFILDKSGIVISTTNPDIAAGEKYVDASLITKLEFKSNIDSTFTYEKDGQKYLVVYNYIKQNSWYIVGIIPYNSLIQ